MGAYAAVWLTRQYVGSMPGPLLYALSLLFAMGVAAVGGLVIGVPCLRLRGDYLAIATLGFGEIVRILAQAAPLVAGGGPRPTTCAPRPCRSHGSGAWWADAAA